MKTVQLPYGREKMPISVEENHLAGVLVSGVHEYKAEKDGYALVADALANPIGTPKLRDMVAGKKKIVLICSDHTRPVPSKYIVPAMLAELRAGSPDCDITLLIATGCHRGTTKEELIG